MSPSIEQLDRFVRSARAGSYSAAAQELYVSPQTVSKSVHDMEHKLNIVLFEPTGRRLRPTARGAQVLHRASEVLEGVDDIRRICGDGGLSSAAGASRLRVAVASSPLRGSVMLEPAGLRRRCSNSFPGTACVRAWRRWRCRRHGIMAFSMKTEGRCS